MMVERRVRANSRASMARPPTILTDILIRGSATPRRVMCPLINPTRPVASAQAHGNAATNSPVRPNTLSVFPTPMASVSTRALASSIGSDGSTTISPLEWPATRATKFTPTGEGEYARGSSSCAVTPVAAQTTPTRKSAPATEVRTSAWGHAHDAPVEGRTGVYVDASGTGLADCGRESSVEAAARYHN